MTLYDSAKKDFLKTIDAIAVRHTPEQARFPELLAITTKGFEAQFGDFLGECFEELGASNSKTGQFFTPYSVARVCAQMSLTKRGLIRRLRKRAMSA